MKNIITILPAPKNRIKLSCGVRSVELDAGFLRDRGIYRCLPVRKLGENMKEAWQRFWDTWDLYKNRLRDEGLYVKKEMNRWMIHYRPTGEEAAQLDKSLTYQRIST